MPSRYFCPNCGAPLSDKTIRGEITRCEACQASFRIPKTYTPEPALGDLILGADFRDPALPGWQLINQENVQVKPGFPPELWARFPASDMLHYVIQASGLFDNFDVSLTIRFLEGDPDYIRGGLILRYTSAQGGYACFISAQGTYKIGWYEKSPQTNLLERKTRLDWTIHSALRKGMGVSNRLRVVMLNDRMRVYLNGVLATTLPADQFQVGQLRLGIEPSSKSAAQVAFVALELREAPRL